MIVRTVQHTSQAWIQMGISGGFRVFREFQLPFSNRHGSIISYNFIRKEKISNAINNCYQVNPLFQKFLDPGLQVYAVCIYASI